MIEQALQVAEEKQPAWKAFPQAAKIRIYMLQGDVQAAIQFAGNELYEAISIPYARYTIFLCLANIELAIARGDHELGLRLIEELSNEVTPLTRVGVPEVIRWKGIALTELGRYDEAHQALSEACSMARKLDAQPQLWRILANLATVNAKLGNQKEAEENLEEARTIIRQIAESLHEIGLSETFMNQPQVRELRR